MTRSTRSDNTSASRSINRVRSPAVSTPCNIPSSPATSTIPRCSASTTTASRNVLPRGSTGSGAVTITSSMRVTRRRPSAPPGCSRAKSSRRNPLYSSRATANASPSASAAVVLVVGARSCGHASSRTHASSDTVHSFANAEPVSPVMPIERTPRPCRCSSRASTSSDSPDLESRIATSPGPTMPRSPCTLSMGWRNVAGVPVEVRVAAILRAMSPDFPTPVTMTRPSDSAISATAAAKLAPIRSSTAPSASRSRRTTRRPSSMICSAFTSSTRRRATNAQPHTGP